MENGHHSIEYQHAGQNRRDVLVGSELSHERSTGSTVSNSLASNYWWLWKKMFFSKKCFNSWATSKMVLNSVLHICQTSCSPAMTQMSLWWLYLRQWGDSSGDSKVVGLIPNRCILKKILNPWLVSLCSFGCASYHRKLIPVRWHPESYLPSAGKSLGSPAVWAAKVRQD